jgi:SAM-dependent methyltransferase
MAAMSTNHHRRTAGQHGFLGGQARAQFPPTLELKRVTYDSVQPTYDRMHAKFLALSGCTAQAALEGAVIALARPGLCVLDAGCGTGQVARRFLAVEPALEMVLLDESPAMLAEAGNLTARRVHGALQSLPFGRGTFDLSLAMWSLETLPDTAVAISELMRVTRPKGAVGLVCCVTEGANILDRALQRIVKWRGLGHPLRGEDVILELQDAGAERIRRLCTRGATMALIAWKGCPE